MVDKMDIVSILMDREEAKDTKRRLNPSDIELPPEYQIEVFAEGLNTPSSMVFNDLGELYVNDSGFLSNDPKVYKYVDGSFVLIADGFHAPMTGINYHNEDIYVSHKGKITTIKPDGTKKDILMGLPSYGDYTNNQVVFGPDGKMYFGQGTVTNSGVVGLDNRWLVDCPTLCDTPGSYVLLNGQNYKTKNIFSGNEETTLTGAFCSFGTANRPYEVHRASVKASGSILKANIDGTNLELVVWGLRTPHKCKFDHYNRLFTTNHGYEVRGSRPIANAKDEFQLILPGAWYGWPDYSAGQPVNQPHFKPEGRVQPEFLLAMHPSIPPAPFATFSPKSYVMGFDFNTNSEFGTYGDAYVAEFGSVGIFVKGDIPYSGIGHKISKIDMISGVVTTFAINKTGYPASLTGSGGFSHPIDAVFGPVYPGFCFWNKGKSQGLSTKYWSDLEDIKAIVIVDNR